MCDITCQISEPKKPPAFLDCQRVVNTGYTMIISGVTDKNAREHILQIANDLSFQNRKILNRLITATFAKDNSSNIEIHFSDFNQDAGIFSHELRLKMFSVPDSQPKLYSYLGSVNTNVATETTQLQLTLAYQAVFDAMTMTHTLIESRRHHQYNGKNLTLMLS